jgi:hypothetical protein
VSKPVVITKYEASGLRRQPVVITKYEASGLRRQPVVITKYEASGLRRLSGAHPLGDICTIEAR